MVKAKAPPAPAGELAEYLFPLRPGLRLKISLPADLTARDVERLYAWMSSLIFSSRDDEDDDDAEGE